MNRVGMIGPGTSCTHCQRSLAPTSPHGLCPACLLSRALRSDIEEELDLQEVRRIGDYEILHLIARGGMGAVFKARQISKARTVAIKLISDTFASADFLDRFRLEAESAARLDHPHIISIYEIGEERGRHFFSMQLAEGGSLALRLGQGYRPSCSESVQLLIPLARAVHFAHQRGILHRDIKPGNILLDGGGNPVLTDFGLAKLVERETQILRAVQVLGTPAYISPEQASGHSSQLTAAADVYGLGAVFYELLSGVPPFSGHSPLVTIRMVLEREPELPSRRNPTIDRNLEIICLKCLEKDPTRRYASAEALAVALERWIRQER